MGKSELYEGNTKKKRQGNKMKHVAQAAYLNNDGNTRLLTYLRYFYIK